MTSVLPPSASPATSTPTSPQSDSPSAGSDGRTGRYALIFGVVSVALTLVVVALAVVAPLFSSASDPLADGWNKVYDSDSQPFSASTWDESKGCDVTSSGLHAASQSSCAFVPSQSADLTSKGFVVDVTVAPPGDVQSEQIPVIYISNKVLVEIDQSGSYLLCVLTCNTAAAAEGEGINVSGYADDWHAATNVSNTIAVRVSINGSTNTLQFYTNGQYVTAVDLSSVSLYGVEIGLGAEEESEALFTHAAIYSASA